MYFPQESSTCRLTILKTNDLNQTSVVQHNVWFPQEVTSACLRKSHWQLDRNTASWLWSCPLSLTWPGTSCRSVTSSCRHLWPVRTPAAFNSICAYLCVRVSVWTLECDSSRLRWTHTTTHSSGTELQARVEPQEEDRGEGRERGWAERRNTNSNNSC